VETAKEVLRRAAASNLGPIRNQLAASRAGRCLTQIRFDRDWFVHTHYTHSRFEWVFVHHLDLEIIRWRRGFNEIIVKDLKASPVE